MNAYSDAAKAFHAELIAVLNRHMAAKEAAGSDYVDTAAEAAAIVGELLVIIFAPIEGDERAEILAMFCHHLPLAVARARADLIAQGMGSALQ